jgi:hypothetical protein
MFIFTDPLSWRVHPEGVDRMDNLFVNLLVTRFTKTFKRLSKPDRKNRLSRLYS